MTDPELAPDEAYHQAARAVYGDQLAHVVVLHPVRQMRVELHDGSRLLLDEHGQQIGRTLPPLPRST